MYLVTKTENGKKNTYFIVNDFEQAQIVYQREIMPYLSKYSKEHGYAWDNRLLDNGELVETLSSYNNDEYRISISTEKQMSDLDKYCALNDMFRIETVIIDERSADPYSEKKKESREEEINQFLEEIENAASQYSWYDNLWTYNNECDKELKDILTRFQSVCHELNLYANLDRYNEELDHKV